MGWFTKKKTSIDNTVNAFDQRTTESLNAGIGGSIDDAIVYSGIDGDFSQDSTNVVVDESFSYNDLSVLDNSVDSSVSSANISTTNDSYDNGIEGRDVYKDIQGGVHITDGGAFALAAKVVDALAENQSEVLRSANDLIGESIAAANPSNENFITAAKFGGGALGAYVVVKIAEEYFK